MTIGETVGVSTAILTTLNLGFGALNAWQNKKIESSILQLKLELSDRIGSSEGDIKALQQAVSFNAGARSASPTGVERRKP